MTKQHDAPEGGAVGPMAKWRHLKTGGIYEKIGQGNIQSSIPLDDMSEVVIYRGADGRLWVRNSGEFHDGRFERLEAAPTPPLTSGLVDAARTASTLRDPDTCRHSVASDKARAGKGTDGAPVMRGTCMWCDMELKAPLGGGWGIGRQFSAAPKISSTEGELDRLRQITDERPWTQEERQRFLDLDATLSGQPSTPPAPVADEEAEPAFSNGVTHAIALLARATGCRDWHIREGSEDRDQDITTTILSVLTGAGLYDEDEGAWARLAAPTSSGLVDRDCLGRLTPEQAWNDLVSKSDRSSPEEYPEMALITYDELARYMRDATLSDQQDGAVPAVDEGEGSAAWAAGLVYLANVRQQPLHGLETPQPEGVTGEEGYFAQEAYKKSTGASVLGVGITNALGAAAAVRRARLAEQPAPAGTGADGVEVWRSMDTAPRDGTPILIAFGSDCVSSAIYSRNDDDKHPWKFIDTQGTGLPIFNGARDDKYGPTGWQPLPKWTPLTRETV